MRIAYFFTDLPDRAGTFPVAELEAMADRGYEIDIFCLRSKLADGDGARRLQARFRIHRAGYVTPRGIACAAAFLLAHPRTFMRMISRAVLDTASHPKILLKTLAILPKCCLYAREVRAGGFDLLWAFWASLPGRAAWWISAATGVPYGTWAHAGNDIYNRAHQTEAALVTILRGARLVCTCNRTNIEYFKTVLPPGAVERIHYQPHGVDLDRFVATGDGSPPHVPAQPVRMLSVGRLGEAKGFRFAIEAVARLRERGVPARYRIIGDGPFRASLETRARELGVHDAIEMPGALEQERLPAEYRASDVFVMPSIVGRLGSRDGLPNVLLEAMACGVPCVGSNAVGIPEAIEHGRTGLLAPPGDPEAIADAVQAVMADREASRRMADAGRRMVLSRFGRDACMDRLAEIFRAAINDA